MQRAPDLVPSPVTVSPRAGDTIFDRGARVVLEADRSTDVSGPRVTLVHERFTDYAGSEKVVSELASLFPEARVVSPIVHDDALDDVLRGRVGGGRLSGLARGTTYAHLLPVLPTAMRHLPLGEPDVVVTSHHAFSNQVTGSTDAPVVSYVHSPARWVWDSAFRRDEAGGAIGSLALAAFAAAYRPADRRAAQRAHTVVANSSAVAERVRAWWGCDAVIVHPPVDTDFYTPDPRVEREDFFLVAGRVEAVLAVAALDPPAHRVAVGRTAAVRDEQDRSHAGERRRRRPVRGWSDVD